MIVRGKSRKDANQPEIERGLRDRFISFVDLSALGEDCPDLLVGFRGRNYLFEIKVPGEESVARGRTVRKGQGKLREGQVLFQRTWGGQTQTAYSLEDILKAIGYKETSQGPAQIMSLYFSNSENSGGK